MLSEHFAMTADALRNRYRVERLLQGGVAACVYVAEDRTSGRRVAVRPRDGSVICGFVQH